MSLLNKLPFFPLYYDGQTKFAPIHCSDVTDTIHYVISKNIYSNIIECTGPEIITFKELLKRLLKLIDKKKNSFPLIFGLYRYFLQNLLLDFLNLCLTLY